VLPSHTLKGQQIGVTCSSLLYTRADQWKRWIARSMQNMGAWRNEPQCEMLTSRAASFRRRPRSDQANTCSHTCTAEEVRSWQCRFSHCDA
jgi:hypothetical protein